MKPWPDQPITGHDALVAAQRRLQSLGHPDARVEGDHEGGPGKLSAPDLVAQVDLDASPTGLDKVRQLAGKAGMEGKPGCLFSLGGYTDSAVAWADQAGLALFVFDRRAQLQPVGRVAADAVARSGARTAPFGTSDLADPLEVAAVVVEGLLGGPVGEIGLWSSGEGQLLTLRPEPGDRDTPGCVEVRLFPPALVEPVQLPEGWEQQRRRLPGGGDETVWTLRCRHANQPPTALAGEAVGQAIAALAAFGIDFNRCRVELRAAPERDPLVLHDAEVLREAVLGPLGRERPERGAPGPPASSAKVLARLLEHTGNGQSGRATIEGVRDDGAAAWRVEARTSWPRLGVRRWQVEARVPREVLEPDRAGSWLTPPTATIGTTRWRLSEGQWRRLVSGRDIEIVAHEVVADLAAACAMGGLPLERTAFRGEP